MNRRVAIIGGGIAGLTAAHRLVDVAPTSYDVHVFEASDRLGGKIASEVVDGIVVPTAPDAFLARRNEMRDLVHELGLGDQMVAPEASVAKLYRSGHLYALPPSVLGIPTDLAALSGLISEAGIRRAEEDLSRPDDRPAGDESVGQLVRRRLGDEILEYIVDPLLGGINAGDSDRLSIFDGAPQIGELRAGHASLLTAARQVRASAESSTSCPSDSPVFLSVRGGLDVVVERIGQILEAAPNANVHLNTSIDRLGRPDAGSARWEITPAPEGDPDRRLFDDVIVATPAPISARLLGDVSVGAAQILGTVEYSSVALVVLVFAPETVTLDASISGVLVPRLEGLHLTAISVATNKWPEIDPAGRQVLRVSVGRRDDPRWLGLDDDELTAVVLDDLAAVIGLDASPKAVLTTRWMDALPQYDVGHRDRVNAIEDMLLQDAPGVVLAGAALRGLGLPACVASGRDAADTVLG